MLFDLRSGKRRRLVQVVYTLLAVSFLVGFVIFGVGSGGVGGIGDIFGGGSNGQATAQYDEKIDEANAQLAKDPKDEKALLLLAENEYFKGKLGVTQDQSTGDLSISSDAHADLGDAADAWERYLKVVKGQPDATAASEMVNVYIYLNDPAGAADAGQILAEQKPSVNSYGNLALFEYAAGDIPAGDEATANALNEASGSQRKQIQKQLDGYRKQAVKQKKQLAKAPKGGTSTALQNPFGSFGGTPPPPSGG